MNKADIVNTLRAMLGTREVALLAERTATLEARNSDTKSSAGDKHEVGRAMVQQELDQLDARLIGIHHMQQELRRVELDRLTAQIGFGSMVNTDQGTYFVAIAIGVVDTHAGACYAISLASPIGQALRGKQAGDVINVNGRAIHILDVR